MKALRLIFKWLLTCFASFFCTVVISQSPPEKTYTTHDGLPQIQVMNMMQDSRGLLWVATKKGLAYFTGSKFMDINRLHTLGHSLTDFLAELPDGKILFNQAGNQQMLTFDGANVDTFSVKNWNGGRIRPVFQIKNYLYFISLKSSEKALYRYNIVHHKLDSVALMPGTELASDKSGNIYFLMNRKELWKQTFDGKLTLMIRPGLNQTLKFNLENKGYPLYHVFKELTNKTEVFSLDDNLKVAEYYHDHTNTLIQKLTIYEKSKSFCLRDPSAIYLIQKGKIELKYLNNQTGSFFLFDDYNHLWHSSENGIQKFNLDGFHEYPVSSVADIWAFIRTSKGKTFFSGLNQGLFEWATDIKGNLQKKKITNPPGIDNLYYFSAIERNNGELYFAHARGIIKIDKEGKVSKIEGTTSCLNLYHDTVKNMTFNATHNGFQMIDYLGHVQTFTDTVFGEKHSTSVLPVGNLIYIGSYKRFCSYDTTKKKYRNLNFHFKNKGLPGAISLAYDYYGNVWVGSREGLFVYNIKKDILAPIYPGLINGFVLALKKLPNDKMFVATNNEAFIIDLARGDTEKYRLKIFNHLNGFMGQEIAQNALFLDQSDTLWIPSATCLSKISVHDFNLTDNPGNVRIKSINEIPVAWNHNQLSIHLKHPNLKIDFESYGFVRPENVRYQYSLDGGNNWSMYDDRDFIFLDGISSGTYKFMVRAVMGSMPNKDQYVSDQIVLHVSLPFYKEPKFHLYALFAGIGFLIFTIIYFWFFRNLQIKSREKENRIKFLQIHTLQSQLNPHFIFNVLGTIQSLIINQNTELANKYLVSFSKLIRRFLDSTVRANSTMDSKGMELEISLKEEIEMLEMYVDFEKLQYENKFDYKLEIDPAIDMDSYTIPPMVIQPFIENSIKHGLMYKDSKGMLDIKFYLKVDCLICEVKDDGVGRKKAADIQAESIKLYKSRGIDLVNQRIKILNSLHYDIRVFTEDIDPTGTRVTIFFNHKP
ncbi:MAG: histidine kinase [Saprospiraceae bacterium]|nr:histidine kinase [Saprospiraceae bacterium]